jgi:hypothetical protein
MWCRRYVGSVLCSTQVDSDPPNDPHTHVRTHAHTHTHTLTRTWKTNKIISDKNN